MESRPPPGSPARPGRSAAPAGCSRPVCLVGAYATRLVDPALVIGTPALGGEGRAVAALVDGVLEAGQLARVHAGGRDLVGRRGVVAEGVGDQVGVLGQAVG